MRAKPPRSTCIMFRFIIFIIIIIIIISESLWKSNETRHVMAFIKKKILAMKLRPQGRFRLSLIAQPNFLEGFRTAKYDGGWKFLRLRRMGKSKENGYGLVIMCT